MRLIGLLSWFDERPTWLTECIASYHQAGITHLVAVDGRYAMYPAAHHRSSFANHDAILATCRGLGISLSLHVPNEPWIGNEVEKRTAMFQYAEAIATPLEDWYLIIDADERVSRALHGWTQELQRTDLDCADVTLHDLEHRDTEPKAQIDRMFAHDPRSNAPIRKLFRAIPGLHCAGNHYTYRTPDGRDLWGQTTRTIEPALDLTSYVSVDHYSQWRAQHRRRLSLSYYDRRQRAGIEA